MLPEATGFQRYNVRIAANALGIVARELELGVTLDVLDAQIAGQLGLDQQVDTISCQIARGLRDGSLQPSAILMDYLRQRTLLSLAIDNPKHSGLQQARTRWHPAR